MGASDSIICLPLYHGLNVLWKSRSASTNNDNKKYHKWKFLKAQTKVPSLISKKVVLLASNKQKSNSSFVLSNYNRSWNGLLNRTHELLRRKD